MTHWYIVEICWIEIRLLLDIVYKIETVLQIQLTDDMENPHNANEQEMQAEAAIGVG